ncbi:hypothetical protein MKZ38_008611 [Zalerion maritima]|uniref:Uncharacterized protein n=1 Tax=Zalerion maritima TaxID=339359 RepID=A0AAD5S0I2_9PEZI|nr:hypothetical protein MKZ38_008611 [Zalerion maritima]
MFTIKTIVFSLLAAAAVLAGELPFTEQDCTGIKIIQNGDFKPVILKATCSAGEKKHTTCLNLDKCLGMIDDGSSHKLFWKKDGGASNHIMKAALKTKFDQLSLYAGLTSDKSGVKTYMFFPLESMNEKGEAGITNDASYLYCYGYRGKEC